MDYRSIFENNFGIQKIKYRGNQGTGLCPFHDDRNPSLSWQLDTGLWTCFSGCGSGNTYQFAERLKLTNPHQYIEPSTMDSKKRRTNGYEPNNALKCENIQAIDVDKMVGLEELKNRYRNNVKEVSNDVAEWKRKYMGKDDDGRSVWFYDFAIKHHKGKDGKPPYWNTKSIDKKCQIFMAEEMSSFDKSKPLIIYEGEKDALIGILQGISFSGGCGSMPDDISQLLVFPAIIIVYDNDDAGRNGAKKLAERIKRETPITTVKIATWDTSLPDGYDVFDDYKEIGLFDEFDKAVANAAEYTIPIPKQIGEFVVMTGEQMDNAEIKPLEWYVEGILPKSFNCMLAGTTGAKKSLYAMQLGLCLANGEKEFCDGKILSPHKVLYVDTEAGQNEVTKRYKKITSHMDWKGSHNWMMISKNGRFYDIWDDLHKAVDMFNPDLLIIDCLYNSTSVNDFSKSSPISNVTNELCDFKTHRGIDTLAVHHFVKGKHDTFNIDRISGASALQNWIEYCMLMVKSNHKNLNLWKLGKTRGAPDDDKVYGLRWDDFWFTKHGVIEDITPLMIDKHVKLKYADIIEDLPKTFDTKDWLNVFNQKHNYSERTGREWLKDATESKLIKKIAHGLYKKHLKLITEENVSEID